MPFTFEFLLEGPPVSLNAKEGKPHARKRYSRWLQAVRVAAVARWPQDKEPLTGNNIQVTIVCYHTDAPPDVDNIVKPIFDAMNGVVYKDDKQVSHLHSRRVSLTDGQLIDPSLLVLAVLDRYTEIVYIRVTVPNEDTETLGEIY